MSRSDDLVQQIRDSYTIIRGYEQTIQTSNRPEERLRAEREIETQWQSIRKYLDEYIGLGKPMPSDIVEIAAHFPDLMHRLIPKPPPDPLHRDFKYDVFVSYSDADRKWVWQTLLPRLERAGLRVCIGERDFEIGVPRLVNIERAVDESRYTLIVMTPKWIDNEWNDFEGLLVGSADPSGRKGRLKPCKLEPCEPPRRIAMLEYADLTDPDTRDMQLARLIRSLECEKSTGEQAEK